MIAAGEVRVKHLVQSGMTTTGSGRSIKVYQSQDLVITDKAGLKAYACKSGAAACEASIDALPDNENAWRVGAEVARFCGRDIYQQTAVAYDSSQCVADVLGNSGTLSVGSTRDIPSRTSARTSNLFADASSVVTVGSFAGMNIQAAGAGVTATTLAQVVTATSAAPTPTPSPPPPGGGGGATPAAAGQDPIGSIELGLAPSSSETGYKLRLSVKAPVYKTSRGEVGGYGSFASRNDLSISTEPHSIHGTLSAGKPKHREDIHFGLYGNRNFLAGKLVLGGELGILDINDLYDDPGLGPRISIDGEVIPGRLTLSGGLFVGATKAVLIAEDPDISGAGYAVNGGFKLTFYKSAARFVRDSYLSLNATYSDGEPVPEYFTLAPAAAVTFGYQRFTLTPSASLLGGVDQEGGADVWIPNIKLSAALALGGGELYLEPFNWSRVMTRDDVASSVSANVDSATGDVPGADSYAATLGINKSQHRFAAGYRGGAALGGGLKSWAAELNYTRVTFDDYAKVSGGGSGSEPSGKEPKGFAGVTLKGTF